MVAAGEGAGEVDEEEGKDEGSNEGEVDDLFLLRGMVDHQGIDLDS